jgi:hypothetical protein
MIINLHPLLSEGKVAECKTKVALMPGGPMVDGTEVQVEESTEKWSEFHLADGTLLRAKLRIVSAVRVDGQYDPQGNPMYAINMTPTMAIIEAPEHLRKKVQ